MGNHGIIKGNVADSARTGPGVPQYCPYWPRCPPILLRAAMVAATVVYFHQTLYLQWCLAHSSCQASSLSGAGYIC